MTVPNFQWQPIKGSVHSYHSALFLKTVSSVFELSVVEVTEAFKQG
jgi:hypothetical protein